MSKDLHSGYTLLFGPEPGEKLDPRHPMPIALQYQDERIPYVPASLLAEEKAAHEATNAELTKRLNYVESEAVAAFNRDGEAMDKLESQLEAARKEIGELEEKIMGAVRAINTVQGLLAGYTFNSGSGLANAKLAWNRNAKALCDLGEYQTRYIKERHQKILESDDQSGSEGAGKGEE